VIASGRHIQRLDEVYFKRAGALVKPFYTPLRPGIQISPFVAVAGFAGGSAFLPAAGARRKPGTTGLPLFVGIQGIRGDLDFPWRTAT